MSGPGGSSDIQAVHRVAEILRLFTSSQPQITVTEAAARIGLNRSTAHRYFTSLVLEHILERSELEPTAFVPGRLLLQIGAVAQGQRNVLEVAPSYLRALSLEMGLTSVLSVWGESGAVVSLVSEAGTPPILITVRVGATLDEHPAQTRLFASLLQDRESVERYLARLPAATRRAHQADVESCRVRGTCWSTRMPNADLVGVAAAIFNEQDITATIALIGTTASLAHNGEEKEAAVVRTAYEITAKLGGTSVWHSTIAERPPVG